mgnify:CR=1 FL=1
MKITIIAIFQLLHPFEHNGDRKGTDFSFIDGANMTPRPSYRHMQMIAKNFGGFYVDGSSSNKDIIIFGSVDKNKISVMIMNRSKNPINYTLKLNNTKASKKSENAMLTIDANSKITHTETIEKLSTQTLVFENGKVVKSNYTNEFFISEQPNQIFTSEY